MRVLRDMNLSKLVDQDEPLFLSILRDLFPGFSINRDARDADFHAALEHHAAQMNLVPHKPWLLKVHQARLPHTARPITDLGLSTNPVVLWQRSTFSTFTLLTGTTSHDINNDKPKFLQFLQKACMNRSFILDLKNIEVVDFPIITCGEIVDKWFGALD